MGRLDGKVALVTGGASGIGRGVVEKFAAEGAHVLVVDIREEGLAALPKDLGSVATLQADVTRESDVQRMVATAVERFGRLDIAVNQPPSGNTTAPAQRLVRVPFWEQPVEAYQRTVNAAFIGALTCMKYEALQMIEQGEGGAIVNIVSISARQPGEGMLAYCSAKAGVEMM